MVTLTINGKLVQAQEGEYLLAVIKRLGIDVPHTCHHDAVEPFGACRLCSVEISKPSWEGLDQGSDLVPLPCRTGSDRHNPLGRADRTAQGASGSATGAIAEGQAHPGYGGRVTGITRTTYEEVPDGNDCILCGLCTRVCDEMGFKAISTVGRRPRQGGCAAAGSAAAGLCGLSLSARRSARTNFIKFTDDGRTRTIWGKEVRAAPLRKNRPSDDHEGLCRVPDQASGHSGGVLQNQRPGTSRRGWHCRWAKSAAGIGRKHDTSVYRQSGPVYRLPHVRAGLLLYPFGRRQARPEPDLPARWRTEGPLGAGDLSSVRGSRLRQSVPGKRHHPQPRDRGQWT